MAEPVIPHTESEEELIALLQQIARESGMKMNLTEGTRKILEELDNQLTTMALTSESNGRKMSDIEELVRSIQEKFMNWESDQTMIWDRGVDAANEYLQAVDEAQSLAESLGSSSGKEDGEEKDLLHRVQSVIQIAMARLEGEFTHVLFQNKQSYEPERMSFRSSEDDIMDEDSFISTEDGAGEDSLRRDSSSKGSEEYIVDLVDPDVIHDLNRIANAMFTSHYDQECCQAYINIRQDALDEFVFVLEVERMSIEEVLQMDWSSLIIKIKKWNRAMKIFARVYLASEKRLCDLIFGEFASVKPTCFIEIAKAPVFQLLTFAEAIAIAPRQPEKLFLILDMYEVLADLLPDIETLFLEEAGNSVRIECREVLMRLGDSIRGTLLEFKTVVGANVSTNPFPGGSVHHLTKYVMNYLKAVTGYGRTLNMLLDPCNGDDPDSLLLELIPFEGKDTEEEKSFSSSTPTALYFKLVASTLECNLDTKSKLYKDLALQHFFLLNNIYYMVQKIKGPELRPLFGDDWIRQHNGKFQHHAMNYERATWNSILSLLKDEGITSPGSNSVSKTVLKERFKSFNISFEEAYKSQTAWLIPDLQLREDLRISVSMKVIQAYRMFMGRHASHLESSRNIEKYIKYNAEDLENFLLDLFEGSQRSLPNSRRR